ncbi:transferase, partial [Streptomyces sp. NPDC054847]
MTAHGDGPLRYTVVIPTVGRPSLTACLRALAAAGGPGPVRVVLVDDRRGAPR